MLVRTVGTVNSTLLKLFVSTKCEEKKLIKFSVERERRSEEEAKEKERKDKIRKGI